MADPAARQACGTFGSFHSFYLKSIMARENATLSLAARGARTLILLILGLVAVGSAQKYRQGFDPANETGRVHAAMAIVDHGTLHLETVWDDVYPGWRVSEGVPNGDASVKDGHYLLDKPPGITLLMVPVIALLRLTGVKLELTDLLGLLAILLAALPAVLFVLAFRRWILRNLGEGRAAVLVAPAVVLATPWLLFGSQVVGHSLAAALAGVGALLALGRLDACGPDERRARGGFLGGFALGGAVLVESSSALLALGAVAALLLDPARRRRLPWLILGGLGPALVFLAWNQVSFGDPLTYGYAHKLTPSMAAAHEQGILGLSWPRTEGLSGLLLSGRRGLFFLAPWLILAPVGVVWACLDRRVTRAWRVLLVLGTVVVPVLLSGFADWHGGQTLGPRYLVFVMPLFGVAAALAVDRLERGPLGPRALPVVAGLLISSLALLLLANAGIPAVTAEIANPLTEVVFPVLFKAGPLGTVWDPLVGAVLGTALAIGAAIALVLLVAAWSGKTPATGVKSRARGATALVIVAALVHLAAVQLPWTREPPHQETVLRARWFCYAYMGEDALRRQLEVEIVRKERR